MSRYGNRHRLCVTLRVPKGRTYKRLRKSDIEFLWIQLEEVIEHGKKRLQKRSSTCYKKYISYSPKRGERTNKRRRALVRKVDSSLQTMREIYAPNLEYNRK